MPHPFRLIRVASFIVISSALILSCSGSPVLTPYFAQGAIVGEVTANSAVMHVRLTANPERDTNPGEWPNTGEETRWGPDPGFAGDCPGAPGLVRFLYSRDSIFSGTEMTPWVSVDSTTDFTHQFYATGLEPASVYFYRPEVIGIMGGMRRPGERGSFTTAPLPAQWADVSFTVITGQKISTKDREDGFNTYISMKKLHPEFLVPTGDNVYYDSDPPIAKTKAVARFHWHRMYSVPTIVDFFRTSSVYFEKDDHDYRWNDSDPHRQFPGISHEEGITVYTEQVPMSKKPYRTFRWGKGLLSRASMTHICRPIPYLQVGKGPANMGHGWQGFSFAE